MSPEHEAIAQALAQVKPDKSMIEVFSGSMVQWRVDVNAIADALEYDNPRFGRYLFLRACDYTE